MPSATPRLAFFRSAAKYLTEPHPFARRSVTMAPHAVPWGIYANRVGRSASFYVPMGVLLLGWPVAAAKFMQKVGV